MVLRGKSRRKITWVTERIVGPIEHSPREMSKLCLFEEIGKEVKGKVLCFKT